MSFHLVDINEVYSNADGSIQFIELIIPNSGEPFFSGHAITVSQSLQPTHTYTIAFDSPGGVFPKTYLIATQGYADFAALHGLPPPDEIISSVTFPNGFLFTSGTQTINYAGVDTLVGIVPTDGLHSLVPGGGNPFNSPKNSNGVTGTIVPPLPPELEIQIPDQFDGVGQAFNFQLAAGTFTEANGDSVTYTAVAIDDDDVESPLPAWLSFIGSTQTFFGTPAGGDVGTIHVKVTATDPDGSASDVFDLTVITGLVTTGNGNANTISGGADDDRISGLGGNDALDGLGGNDTLIGGLGNDTFGVDSASDTVTELSGQGTDLIQTSVTLPGLVANVENLTLLGVGNLNATGNGLNNVLTGNDGNNTFNGAGGADTMVGGDGNDTFLVDSTTDQVIESLNEGTDLIITALALSTLAANVENLTLTGGANIAGIGNGLANAITGNTGSNFIAGGAGNDTLDGGAGNDILNGGADNDAFQFSEFSSTDRIVDFNSGGDQIFLDDALFTSLGLGAVAAGQLEVTTSSLVSGTSGDDAGGVDYLKYAIDTGELYYDDNGTTAGGLHLIAILASPGCSEPHPTLDLSTAQDIVVV